MISTIILALTLIAFAIVSIYYYLEINNIMQVDMNYDRYLNKLMDDKLKFRRDFLTIHFDGVKEEIWVSNYPYSYGCVYPKSDKYPTMKTRRRLNRYITGTDNEIEKDVN